MARGLEDNVLKHTRQDDMKVSVFTGPFFSEDDIAFKDARIPLAFWKVIAFVTEEGRPSATAYRVYQKEPLHQEFNFGGYKEDQISIQQVIDATDIDFSPLLDYDGITARERTTEREVSVGHRVGRANPRMNYGQRLRIWMSLHYAG